MDIRRISIAVVVLFLTGNLCAQGFNKARLDSLLNLLASHDKIMGSVTISKHGKPIYQRALGKRLISSKKNLPATPETIYRVGSISKMFTATMIFQLIDEGKLTLETSLSEFYPKLPNASKITIAMLLNHHSGLFSLTSDSTYGEWHTKPQTHEQLLTRMEKYPSEFEPNTKAEYSNTGYIVLSFIVEKVTGKKYAEALKERITSRLGLKHTYYGKPADPKQNEAYSYKFDGSWKQEDETDMSVPAGAGAVVSTAADLNIFLDGLLLGKLVSPKSLTLMKTQTDNYGMGLFEYPFAKKTSYGHYGNIDEFASGALFFPSDSIGITFLSNGQQLPFGMIYSMIIKSYYDQPFELPILTTIHLTADEVKSYEGVFSSPGVPLKISYMAHNDTLYSQATGQGAFPLTASAPGIFTYYQAGLKVVFSDDKKHFTLYQGGGKFEFTKDN